MFCEAASGVTRALRRDLGASLRASPVWAANSRSSERTGRFSLGFVEEALRGASHQLPAPGCELPEATDSYEKDGIYCGFASSRFFSLEQTVHFVYNRINELFRNRLMVWHYLVHNVLAS